MKPTNLIFLLGASKAGKDTIGNSLVEKHNYTRVSFADAMKEEFAKLNNITVDTLLIQGPEKEFWRPRLIEYAEAKRAINPTCWLELGFEPYLEQGAFKEGLNLVVTDCRRDAEIDWVVQQKEIIKSVNDAAQHLHEQKYRNRDLSETIVMEKHYYNVYLVYVKNEAAEKVDTDVLTHYCIGYAKGSRAIDITLVNDSTLNELNKKTDNLIKYFETTI